MLVGGLWVGSGGVGVGLGGCRVIVTVLVPGPGCLGSPWGTIGSL